MCYYSHRMHEEKSAHIWHWQLYQLYESVVLACQLMFFYIQTLQFREAVFTQVISLQKESKEIQSTK